MKELKTSYIAKKINGTLIGHDKTINGIFNFLNAAQKGDAVIRHWINEKGVEIAAKKGVSCVITQNPKGDTIKTAEKLELPIIITKKIELANAFAIKWAINKFARDSVRVVITGTNGKSTTAHIIYNILKEAGYSTYTNTDSKSEFNTLIDPMVAKQIAEFGEKIDAMVIEVSEVQGWLDNIMKDHAYLMTSAIDPDVVVITNVALDHIGLVNSVEETFDEISGAAKAINKKNSSLILNYDDSLVRKMENPISTKNIMSFGNDADISLIKEGIVYNKTLIIKKEDIPLKGNHFIQNAMAAIGAAISLNITPKIIEYAIKTYTPLKRRFTIINDNPCIIDDFAHNPEGIRATIENADLIGNGNFFVVSAIRGSRGEIINQINADAIADGLQNTHYKLVITSSSDVVDNLNIVTPDEKKVFIDTLENRGIKYIFYKRLYDALEEVLNSAHNKDTILLIGAQGMDPANELLEKILKSKKNRCI